MDHLLTYEAYSLPVRFKKPTKDELKKFADKMEFERLVSAPELNLVDAITVTSNCTAAVVENEIAGFVSWSTEDTHTSIDLLFIDPEFRKGKIATMFINHIINLDETGTVITHPYTESAERFFRKLGFVADEEFGDDTNTLVYYHVPVSS